MQDIDSENKLPPFRAYSKKQLRYLVVDPLTNPDAPTCQAMSRQHFKKQVVSRGILYMLDLTEAEYDAKRTFSPSESEIILRGMI